MNPEPQSQVRHSTIENLLKWALAVLIVLALFAGLFTAGFTFLGVWPPDVVSLQTNTLATAKSPDGHVFRVFQYWNRVDFYSTELHVTGPDGRVVVHTLDGDDAKTWQVPILVDSNSRTVSVRLRDSREVAVKW